MSSISVGFWNVQNLFDTKLSDIAKDFEYTPEEGWTEETYKAKLDKLAEVIKQMNGGALPDLLGLCEIENVDVVEDLVDRLGRPDYKIAHVDSPDIRGIDVTLIYSEDIFELNGTPVGHLIHLRYPTRDIFEVPLRVKSNGKDLTVFVCHWPSRSRGQYESEPYRITVAAHCGTLVDKVVKFTRDEYLGLPDTEAILASLNDRWNRNVLVMGDLNDEPFNRSMLDYLRASKGLDHLEEPLKKSSGRNTPSRATYLGKQAYTFNCMHCWVSRIPVHTTTRLRPTQ